MERRSKQRDEIRRILSERNFHPTIEELYGIAKKSIPGLGIATIYRNVEKMLNNNEIVRIEVPGEAARFDGNTEKHFHFRCEKCGNVKDVWLELQIEQLFKTTSPLKESTVNDYSIEFTGLCPNCKQKAETA